jgi:hypothetical protein
VITLVLNVLSPDAFIAQINVARSAQSSASSERPLDATYLARLNADAVPTLLQVLPSVPREEGCQAATILLQRWSTPSADWRAWNWSRAQAAQLVNAQHGYLEEIACEVRPTYD